jgi:hypothetical protein
MRNVIAILVILAVILAIGPVFWLGLFTVTAFGHISIYGLIDYWSGGALLAAAACWWGYVTAFLFVRRSFMTRSRTSIRSAWIISGLLVGIVGGVVVEVMSSPSPIVYIPWGFFLWPTVSLVILGLLGPMWPNPALNADAEHSQRAG